MEIIWEAVTHDGKIYKDLPFLIGDMADYWIRGSGGMSIDQRQNFASFQAKLSAVGIADDGICGCALIVLRDTLESTRPLDKVTPCPTVVSKRLDQGDHYLCKGNYEQHIEHGHLFRFYDDTRTGTAEEVAI